MRLGCCGSMISPETDPIGIGIVDSLAEMGFDYVELSLAAIAELPKAAFTDLARMLASSSVPCEACNNFFPPCVRLTGPEAQLTAALDYATAAMDRAARIGARIIVFGSSGARNVAHGTDPNRAWKQLVELLQRLGPLAQERDLTIAIEPLNRSESNIVNSAAQGLQLVRDVKHPHIQLLIDFYHSKIEREGSESIVQAGRSVRHLHVARVAGRTFPLQSDNALREFFELVRSIRFIGRCSLEAYTWDFASEAPRSLRLLRKLTKDFSPERTSKLELTIAPSVSRRSARRRKMPTSQVPSP